jgi:hypothetical protein
MIKRIAFYILLIAVFSACQEEDTGINPFDNIVNNQDTVKLNILDADPNSIAGIYQNVLKPTCANVACHDGVFEPDFRTIESAYNTLVFQEPIKNNGDYLYRVEPFKPDASVIIARLENIISPQMPFTVEPDSDWNEKRTEYIQNIKTWIANGAPDIAGNIPTEVYPKPILLGAGAYVNSIWQQRAGGSGALQISRSASIIDFYFSFNHEFLDSEDLTYNKIGFSDNPNNFDSIPLLDLQILQTPLVERGFYGDDVLYTHKISINPNSDIDPNKDLWYFRVYIQDDVNPVTEIPTDNGIYYIKNYMSFEKID